jgi:hypothetical protein
MQELIDKVEHAISYNVEGGLVEKYTWEEFFNDMYVLLEKEKEQITDSYIMGSYDMAEKEFRPEQYYNETYNQNQ